MSLFIIASGKEKWQKNSNQFHADSEKVWGHSEGS